MIENRITVRAEKSKLDQDNIDCITRIIKLRTEKGISRKELAARSGISERTISYWEQYSHEVKAIYMPAIFKALEVTPNEFFSYSDKYAKPIPKKQKSESMYIKNSRLGEKNINLNLRFINILAESCLSLEAFSERSGIPIENVKGWITFRKQINSGNIPAICAGIGIKPADFFSNSFPVPTSNARLREEAILKELSKIEEALAGIKESVTNLLNQEC